MDAVLQAVLGLDSSGFQDGLGSASGALQQFASIAGGVFAGMGASNLFSSLTSGIGGFMDYMVGTTSDFQSYGQTFGQVLNNLSSASDTTTSALGTNAAKAASSALEAQDALIKYNEKVAEIQQNIADVMSGDNITQAEQKFSDQMASIQQAYADKVQQINDQIAAANDTLQQTLLDNQQRATDTLSDMQATHANQVADTKEKQAYELSQTTSAVEKAALQKKFDAENQMAEDAYQRQYTLKKEIEDRTVKEEDERAQDQHDKQIASLEDELAREATLEQQKEDKLKQQEADEISRLETQNAKKLAQYKQELADEERAYQLSLAKRAASASSGGGGALGQRSMFGFGPLTPESKGESFFANINESAQELEGHMMALAQTEPFKLHDLMQMDQGFTALGLNAEKTQPIMADLAGYWHTSLATASQAVVDELSGNGRMLMYNFHITKAELENAFGGKPIKSANDLMVALNNLDKANSHLQGSFAGGSAVAMRTLPGQMSNIEDKVQLAMMAFMGFDTSFKHFGDMKPDGLFAKLLGAVSSLANYMMDHQADIAKFAAKLGTDLVGAINAVVSVIKFLIDHGQVVMVILEVIGGVLAGLAASGIIAGIIGIVTAFAGFISTIAVLAGGIMSFADVLTGLGLLVTALGGPITVAAVIIGVVAVLIITHWSQVKSFVGAAIHAIIGFFQAIPGALSSLVSAIGNFVVNAIAAFLNFNNQVNAFFMRLPFLIAYAIGFIIGVLFAFVTHTLPQWVGNVVNLMKQLPGFIWNVMTDLWNREVTGWTNIFNWVITAVPAFLTNVVTIFAKLPGQIWDAIMGKGGILDKFKDTFTTVKNFIQSMLGDVIQWGINIANALIQGIVKGLEGLKDALIGGIKAGIKAIQGKSPPEEGPLKDVDIWGYNIGNAWVQGFQEALGGFSGLNLGNIVSGLGGNMGVPGSSGIQNYNTQNNLRTNNVVLNNSFQISSEGSARNVAQYLAFQSDHFGIV